MIYFLDCECCTNIDDYCDLKYNDSISKKFPNLISIYNKREKEDRHYSFRDILMKCEHCATVYYNSRSVDTEDAFVGGPDFTNNFQRVNLIKLKELLKKLGLDSELKELNKRYQPLIKSFKNKLKESPCKIRAKDSRFNTPKPFYFHYVIESICDYYIENNDFEGLENSLLMHERPEIVFKTIKDIILMYKEKSYDSLFPFFTHYKSISVPTQKRISPFIEKYIKKIIEHLNRFKDTEDEAIRRQYNSVLSKANYYNLIK